jgi:hypothetical protein
MHSPMWLDIQTVGLDNEIIIRVVMKETLDDMQDMKWWESKWGAWGSLGVNLPLRNRWNQETQKRSKGKSGIKLTLVYYTLQFWQYLKSYFRQHFKRERWDLDKVVWLTFNFIKHLT